MSDTYTRTRGTRGTRRTFRTAVALAAAAAGVCAVTACGPDDPADAAAPPTQSGAPSSPAADPSQGGDSQGDGSQGGDDAAAKSPEKQVLAFLEDYKAASAKNDQVAELKVKKEYVTLQYQPQLAAWEEANSADGVFRAQNVPESFVAEADDSRTTQDSVFVVATFTWAGADNTRVEYQVDTQDLKVRNIKELD